MAQLKKERQKSQNNLHSQHEEKDENQKHEQTDNEDDHRPVVTRMTRTNTMPSAKKHASATGVTLITAKKETPTTTSKTPGAQNVDEHHQPVVSRIARTDTMTSTKKHASSKSSMPTLRNKDSLSTPPDDTPVREDKQYVTRIPRSETTTSFKKLISTTTCKNSNLDTSRTCNGLDYDISQSSSNPYQTSSVYLMSKSEIFDQEFYLDENKDHIGRNDVRSRGKINISNREK